MAQDGEKGGEKCKLTFRRGEGRISFMQKKRVIAKPPMPPADKAVAASRCSEGKSHAVHRERKKEALSTPPFSLAPPNPDAHGIVRLGDNLPLLREMKSESVALIYIDPPFNTGKRQTRKQIRTVRDDKGDRIGFGGNAYRTETIGESGYADAF